MELVEQARHEVMSRWQEGYKVSLHNQKKVLDAFHRAKVGSDCFHDSTGYGYHDLGRTALENAFAYAFNAETALVRPQIVSGTHAIYLALSILKPGEELISIAGPPYDTLRQVIGTKGQARTALLKKGIAYQEIPLTEAGCLDLPRITAALTSQTRLVFLQRSRGYSWRRALTVAEIEAAAQAVHNTAPECIVFVDNCYGEFVETLEPTDVGADLMAGSLIKNPGGTLAVSGGYVVGKADLIEEIAEMLIAPGIGRQAGPTYGLSRSLLQGLFMAPHVVQEALAGAVLTAKVFANAGFAVSPGPWDRRGDIVQAIGFDSSEQLLQFCAAVQEASPIDAHYLPEPDLLPGYDDPVVMAGGTFIQGSSIELSADAPMRTPFTAYFQGGFSREHVEIALQGIAAKLGLTDRR